MKKITSKELKKTIKEMTKHKILEKNKGKDEHRINPEFHMKRIENAIKIAQSNIRIKSVEDGITQVNALTILQMTGKTMKEEELLTQILIIKGIDKLQEGKKEKERK